MASPKYEGRPVGAARPFYFVSSMIDPRAVFWPQ
jgi:hypothetical protein